MMRSSWDYLLVLLQVYIGGFLILNYSDNLDTERSVEVTLTFTKVELYLKIFFNF